MRAPTPQPMRPAMHLMAARSIALVALAACSSTMGVPTADEATLRQRGVLTIWAVQGPADASYSQKEIGNSKIAAAMIPKIDGSRRFILAARHSSGSFVAHELFEQLSTGADPSDVTKAKIV